MLSEKVRLRKEYKRRRAAIPPELRRHAGAEIAGRLSTHPWLLASRTVYLYLAFGSEVPTDPLVQLLTQQGARIFAPPIDHTPGPLHAGRLLKVEPGCLPATPVVHEAVITPLPVAEIDLFLVPGIAWDEKGYRIGYGGGFFDRLLSAARPDSHSIGLAYELQIGDLLPAEPWDIPVDAIITESRTIECGRNRANLYPD